MERFLTSGNHSNLKRQPADTSSFIDPAIIASFGKTSSSFNGDEYEEDSNTITSSHTGPSSITSSVIYTQRSPPQPTASTSLDHLWSKKEKYDNLELRLLALEESEKRFEYRLQMLEVKEKNIHRLSMQPLSPDQQTSTSSSFIHQHQHQLDSNIVSDHDGNDYKSLYLSLLDNYNTLKSELKEKEQKIQVLLSQVSKQEEEQEEETSYREEGGYLLFDTTTMNGDITHCRVKIPPPPPSYYLATPPATRVSSPQHLTSTPRRLSHHHHTRSTKKGLNPNAPEWRKRK